VIRQDHRYLVIDGNSRVEIYRDLKKKYPRKEAFKKIKAYILPQKVDDKTKDFIRLISHLRGVNDWDVYERARMLYHLWENKGYTEEELQATTKLSVRDIKRMIEAYKTMTEQFLPNYGHQPDALTKFSYFIEYENTKIKEGMETVDLTKENFVKWVGEGEIIRAQDVRDLKKIFENKEATQALVSKGFKYACEALKIKHPEFGSKFFEQVEGVIEGLRTMSRWEEDEIIRGDIPFKKKMLEDLFEELKKLLRK